jgi:hypothetical protein
LATASESACAVHDAVVPVPTTVVGLDTSAAWIGTGQVVGGTGPAPPEPELEVEVVLVLELELELVLPPAPFVAPPPFAP